MRQAVQYLSPRTLAEALELLHTHAGCCKPYAGGTDLMVQLRDGAAKTAAVQYLMDLQHLPELFGIQKNAGQLSFNGGAVIDTNRYFADPEECAFSALMLCEMAFAAINAGIFALCYWSFCDHPAPFSCAYSNKHGSYAEKWSEAERFFSCTTDTKYNKFGFTKWDDFAKDYGARAHYYGVAPMIKLLGLAISGPKSVIAPTPMKIRDGKILHSSKM